MRYGQAARADLPCLRGLRPAPQVEVGGRFGGGRLKAEGALREPFDARRRHRRGDLRCQIGVLGPEPGALARGAVELHVLPQHGDVDRYQLQSDKTRMFSYKVI